MPQYQQLGGGGVTRKVSGAAYCMGEFKRSMNDGERAEACPDTALI
jgi:hypothetical protein